ncbi:MAG: hypothetical protein AAF579_10145, partial [Cyanobacteria bacterium P01_C01_bin.118]
RALGAVQITFSVLVLVGVGVVDSVVNKIDWSLGSNLVWLGMMALFGIIGFGLIYQSFSDFWKRAS